MSAKSSITVLFSERGESLATFERTVSETKGEILVIFSELEQLLTHDKNARKRAMTFCKKYNTRLRIASRHQTIIRAARARGIRVVESVSDLRKLLADHPSLDDALREFQPNVWRQQLRSRLQKMGLLSLPRIRIWALILVSAGLFFFVFFRLLPSATVYVSPHEETISQTANIFLAQSGAVAALPPRVRVMPLIPIVVQVEHSITFDQISRVFIGSNAEVAMTVINNSTEPYWLKKGSRLKNQAGMVFRLQYSIQVEPADEVLVKAVAEPEDLYGEIVGKRGNVPKGLKWEFPGLSKDERALVYAENRAAAEGGVSDYTTVLSEDDFELGRKLLEQELLSIAKRSADEKRELMSAEFDTTRLELLYYEELTKVAYDNFFFPEQFLGEAVQSVPIEGSITYTTYAYDTQEVLDMLSRELISHVGEGKRLLEESLSHDRLVAHVIDYEDDFSWIKLTVDLSGTHQHILDPLSPTGAVFAKKVRESVRGLHKADAERIVGNYPEVKKAE
ncbi:MAG: hypothetical protein QF442_02040, partial [Candidatus Peribacteraceae bacterium]|nr:hypothetical protein [Candidatus Peribacteraceae bacterium]